MIEGRDGTERLQATLERRPTVNYTEIVYSLSLATTKTTNSVPASGGNCALLLSIAYLSHFALNAFYCSRDIIPVTL